METEQKNFSENYSILETVGEGAIGRVLLAFDKRIERNVAIKELKAEKLSKAKDIATARFLREAKITGQLEHPCITPVYELAFKEDGNPFYSMKYIKGTTLHDAVISCNSPTKEEAFAKRISLLDKFINVCEAVGYAHSKGIVHRDLKLGNIILGSFGEVAILDWGLAKKLGGHDEDISHFDDLPKHDKKDIEEKPFATHDGAILGTPSYMPPEQANSRWGKIGTYSDVYALGTILFSILTGQRPYKEKGLEVIKIIDSKKPSPVALERLDLVPPPLSAICAKAMEKEPSKRFQDAGEMAKELKAYRDGRIVSVYAYSRKELFKRFIARNKTVVALTSVLILSVIAGGAFSVNFAIEAHKARAKAENTLINVTELTESTAYMAQKLASTAAGFVEHLKKKDPKLFQKKMADPKSFFPEALGLDPTKSVYQIWVMGQNGRLIYDEDPKEIGKDLFTDETYASFPELLTLGKQIKEEDWGVGHYSYHYKGGKQVIYKIAAWSTVKLDEKNKWDIIATLPYFE